MIYAELPQIVRDRIAAVYGAGLTAGGNGPWMSDDDPQTLAFIRAVEDDWFTRLETWQATRPAWPSDGALPEWFRAELEREPIRDARPPEGWLLRVGSDGKP